MSAQVLNVGIVGTGTMAAIYADIVSAHPYCHLTTALGRSLRSCERFNKKYPCTVIPYYDWGLFLRQELDLVILAVDESYRLEPYEALSDKPNLNLLLEKPFATSRQNAIYYSQLFKNHKGCIRIAHSLRSSNRFNDLKRLLDAFPEDILTISSRRNSNSVRVQRVLSRFDLTHWLLPHDIDISSWLTGSRIVRLSAFSRTPSDFGKYDFIRVVAQMSNGTSLSMENLWTTDPLNYIPREASYEMRTPTRVLALDDTDMNVTVYTSEPDHLRLMPDTYEHYFYDGKPYGMFAMSVDSLASSILSQSSFDNSEEFKNAIYIASVCDAINQSRLTQQPVTIPHE